MLLESSPDNVTAPERWIDLDIYVDGDACPVKDEVLRVAERHQIQVHLVSNRWLRQSVEPLVNPVLVAETPDAADDWIAEHIGTGDIVITGDIPLADRCLKKDAEALGHNGKPFTKDSIGMALAMRNLKTHLRETGEIMGGGPAFSKQDRSRFLMALEDYVQAGSRTLNRR